MRNISWVELFKLDFSTNEMTILMEPFKKNVIIKYTPEKMEEVASKYKHFCYKDDGDCKIYAQDLFDESLENYECRRLFKKEYAQYY